MRMFSRHSRDLGMLVARLDAKPRFSRVMKEPGMTFPGEQDLACAPDVVTFRPDPHDVTRTYMTAYEVYSGNRPDEVKRNKQATRWYEVIDAWNRFGGGPEIIPRFVFWNSRTDTYTRVRR